MIRKRTNGLAVIQTALLSILREPAATIFSVFTLLVLALQTQWGVWKALDWPIIDEAWVLIGGYRLAHGDLSVHISAWDSPFATLSYALSTLVFRSMDAAFYAQRILFSIAAVLALYFLLRRLLPAQAAWVGAVMLLVSPFLISLTFDRTDFLAACACAWAALAIMDTRSRPRMIAALSFAFIGALFRPEGYLFLFSCLIFWGAVGLHRRSGALRAVVFSMLSFALIAAAGVGILANSKTIGDYFTWVFANNRWNATWTTGETIVPMWQYYEQSFGPQRNIIGILSHPASLAKDMLSNAVLLLSGSKRMLSSFTFAEVSIPGSRWFLGMALFSTLAAVIARHAWASTWKFYWEKYSNGWLNMLCIAPSIAVLLFIRALPVQVLLLAPLVIGLFLLVFLVLLRNRVHPSVGLFLMLVLGVLVWIASPYRDLSDQKIRSTVYYIHENSSPTAPLSLLGNSAETVCPYLQTIWQQNCSAVIWSDRDRDITLAEFSSKQVFNYLIYDPGSMAYLLAKPVGLAEVIDGENPDWLLAAEFGEIKVFHNAKQPAR